MGLVNAPKEALRSMRSFLLINMGLLSKGVSITKELILRSKIAQESAIVAIVSDLCFNINALKVKIIKDGRSQIMAISQEKQI